jgi:hypothetical protein
MLMPIFTGEKEEQLMMKKLVRLVSITAFGAALAIAGQTYLAEAKPTAAPAAPAATTQSTWQWQGCWGWFSSGCPFEIYRNSATGQYRRCNGCTNGGTNPNPQQCATISQQSLNVGYWCS